MYLYVELWNAKQAWKDLSKEERAKYAELCGGAIQNVLASGDVEILGWGINDPDTDHRAGYDYIGVWKFKNKEALQSFEGLVTQAGWHNYFEQISAASPMMAPPDVMGHSVNI
ncbi:MAG: DUF6616 family protein [Candidatus Sericytochromatia bacterium]